MFDCFYIKIKDMKEISYLKEIGIILLLKCCLLYAVWWLCFSEATPKKELNFSEKVFGVEKIHDK